MATNTYIKGVTNTIITSSRPSWMPPRPDLNDPDNAGIWYLIEHIGEQQTLVNLSNQPVQIYIDGIHLVDLLANEKYIYTLKHSDHLGIEFNGRYFSWIQIKLPTNACILLSKNYIQTHPNEVRMLNVLEVLINQDIDYIDLPQSVNAYKIMFKPISIWFKPNVYINHINNLFSSNYVNIENMPILRGSGFAFSAQSSNPLLSELDCQHMTQMQWGFIGTSSYVVQHPLTIKLLNTENFTNINNILYGNFSVQSFMMSDCSNIHNIRNSFYKVTSLNKLILPNLGVSFNISYCYAMSINSTLELIDSIADMTEFTSPTIKLTDVGLSVGEDVANDSSIIAACAAKNWTIVV